MGCGGTIKIFADAFVVDITSHHGTLKFVGAKTICDVLKALMR